MSHTVSMEGQRKPWLIPLFLSLLLLLLIGGVFYWFHWGGTHPDDNPAAAVRLAQAVQHIDALAAEKTRLKELIDLDPCEAKKRLASPPVSSSGGGTVSSSFAFSGGAPNDVVNLLERACVFILCISDTGISTGSGFFIAPQHIVTNAHVVADKQGHIFITSKALGRPVLGDIIARDKSNGRDYALLRIDTPQDASIAVPPFAESARRTEKVGAWGFPHVIGKSDPAYRQLLDGKLSSVPELAYSEGVVSAVLNRTPSLIVHTASISPGNSGGPLANDRGQIVGINTMITLDEDSYRQASIAIAAQDLRSFLVAHGVSIRVGDKK